MAIHDAKIIQIKDYLKSQTRVSYRGLKRRFGLSDPDITTLKNQLIDTENVAIDINGKVIEYIHARHETPTTQLKNSARKEAERRLISVMYCDIVGSTRLSEQIDPEDMRQIIRHYQKLCSNAVSNYEGTIAQLHGDGILIFFGYPKTHEDDGYRAVAAGLDILKNLNDLNQLLVDDFNIAIQIRIGIHSGLTVCGTISQENRNDILAFGETTKIAEKMQNHTPPDSIIITSKTAQLVQGFFKTKKITNPALKREFGDLGFFQVNGYSGLNSRFDIHSRLGLSPLLARDAEVSLVEDAWKHVRRGTGKIVHIQARSGLGKTRLINHCKENIVVQTPETNVLECYCSTYYRNTPLYPLIYAFANWFELDERNQPQQNWEQLVYAISQITPEAESLVYPLATMFPHLLPAGVQQLQQTPKEHRRFALHSAIIRIIKSWSKYKPLALIIDDLQWADPTTLEIIDRIADLTPYCHLLCLFTSRPEFGSPWYKNYGYQPIELAPIPPEQRESFIKNITTTLTLTDHQIVTISEKSDGNPLFLEELTRVFNSETPPENLSTEKNIPSTIQGILAARLDNLGEARELAQIGSVIGRGFSYELLKEASDLDDDKLAPRLNTLIENELLSLQNTQQGPVYIFRHGLLCDMAYNTTLKRDRQKYHRRIARFLLKKKEDTVPSERIAYHCKEAGDWKNAIIKYQDAGENAIQAYNNTEAISHFEEAQALTSHIADENERGHLKLTAGIRLLSSIISIKGFQDERVIEMIPPLEKLCHELPPTEEWFYTTFALHFLRLYQADYHHAEILSELLITSAKEIENEFFDMVALIAKGTTKYWQGKNIESIEYLKQALEIYDPGRHSRTKTLIRSDIRLYCECHMMHSYWQLGKIETASQMAIEIEEYARKISHTFSECNVLIGTSNIMLLRGETEKARERISKLLELSNQYQLLIWYADALVMQGLISIEDGSADIGIEQMKKGIMLHKATGAQIWRTDQNARLAEEYLKVNQTEKALEAINEALVICQQSGHSDHFEPELHRLRALSLHQQGEANPEAIYNCFMTGLELARQQPSLMQELRIVTSMAEISDTIEENEKIRLLTEIIGKIPEKCDSIDITHAQSVLKLLQKEAT